MAGTGETRPTAKGLAALSGQNGDMPAPPPNVSLLQIFQVFFAIGAFSFGGGLLGWIHREIVVARNWLTDEQFLPGVVISRVLPGSNVANLAIYIGDALRGPIGGLVAMLAVICGPFFLCIGLSVVYEHLSGSILFHAALAGASAAAIGMGLRVAWTGAWKTCRSVAPALVVVLVVVATVILHWPLTVVVLVFAPVGVVLQWRKATANAE